jgi:hypothetical protein
MMKKSLFISIFLGVLLNCTAQVSTLETSNLQDSLLGYWYHEHIEEIGTNKEKRVQKLFFSKDTLIISDFGDQHICNHGGTWVCKVGTWKMNSDTLVFKPHDTMGISTNTGIKCHPCRYGIPLGDNTFSFIVKKVDDEVLIVDMIVTEYSFATSSGRLSSKIISRTYQKSAHLNMCTECTWQGRIEDMK